jgi:hypothetical protein
MWLVEARRAKRFLLHQRLFYLWLEQVEQEEKKTLRKCQGEQ